MKKYGLMSLVLFFATSAAIGMESKPADVYISNLTGHNVLIKAKPTLDTSVGRYKFSTEVATVESSQKTHFIGKLNQIADIETSGPAYAYGNTAWTSNKDTLELIKKEALQDKNKNKDIYLEIGSGVGFGGKSYFIKEAHWVNSEAQAKPNEVIPFEFEDIQVSKNLQNILKNKPINDNTKIAINEIWEKDITKNKRFRKQLEVYAQSYADQKTFENNVNKLLHELRRVRTLDIKTLKMKM